MAESDFGIFGAAAASIKRGATTGQTVPNGGGHFTFGFNSVSDGAMATGLYYNLTKFAPLRDDSDNATGGSVRCVMKRGPSAGSVLGYSVGLFINLTSTSESYKGYLLGLSNDDPSSIILAKAAPIAGLDPTNSQTCLKLSSETFLVNTWVHLRLDSIVNPNGDVILKCFKNDLSINPCTSPNWQAIPGMDDYVDDALGVESSTDPLAGGYGGWFFQSSLAQSRGFVDMFEMSRQM